MLSKYYKLLTAMCGCLLMPIVSGQQIPQHNNDSHHASKVVAHTLPTSTTKSLKAIRDCSNCPDLVVVPAGSFMMGTTKQQLDKDRELGFLIENENENAIHQVTINYSFAVGKYEVTFAEWDACVADGGCQGYQPDDSAWGRGSRPVMNVSWYDAKNYVQWLSKKTGKKYRLLSEAEWEYVARAGSTTRYSWGDDIGINQANCYGCGSQWDDTQTASVGSFSPNKFGLYDVVGNVGEWVEDCWHDSYNKAPTDGGVWENQCTDDSRIVRGGSWFLSVQLAARGRNTPDSRSSSKGFRVARDL